MKPCTCCRSAMVITAALNVRSMVYPDLIDAVIGECPNCGSTQAWVVWEFPEELDLVDGELGPMSHERDAQEVEAA